MGMICLPRQVKTEVEGGRGSYKCLQFLTLPPKAQMSGVKFHEKTIFEFLFSLNLNEVKKSGISCF